MEHSASAHTAYHGTGPGRATGGAIGIFTALGVGLAVLAFVSAFGLQGATSVEANDVVAGVSALLVGVFPFLAVPILATLAGTWAGTRTKGAGSGAVAGALGTLVGTIVLFLLVGVGFLLGAAAAGVDITTIQWPENLAVPPGVASLATFLVSASGLTYLFANVVTGGVAGSIAGAVSKPAVVIEREVPARRTARL